MFKLTWSCGISKVRFERVGDGFLYEALTFVRSVG